MKLDRVRGFLVDIDGVLTTGGMAIPGAKEAINLLRDRGIPFRCVSNSTRRCRASIAGMLENQGLEIGENMIFTPPLAAVKLMEETNKHRAFLLTTDDVESDFSWAGILINRNPVDYVVVGDAGEKITYETMNQVFRHVMSGAEIIALEKDRFWMAPEGLSLSAGPFVTALEFATGKTASVVGKPAKAFFDLALRDMDVEPAHAVMIGDDVTTDIGGAHAAGMRGILVRTGKFRNDVLNKSGVVPEAILNSIDEIKTVI